MGGRGVVALWVAGLLAVPASAVALQPPVGVAQVDSVRGDISPAQEQAMWEEIRRNREALERRGLLAAPEAAVTYTFPLRVAPGLPDYAGFRVSAFADHNPAAGQVLDYDGGTRTYDGHRGTDYALWPFGWNKAEAGDVQVIAAAAGTILSMANVDPTDRNPCDGGSSSDPWNYVALQHADGRLTIYGHLRYNSLTSKTAGAPVAQGEYLGTPASSGNSSGPHLHFEVRFGGFTSAEWIDPYAGPQSQPESLWAAQRPYRDSAVNKLSTHSAQPVDVYSACNFAVPNLQESFTTPARIRFDTYYRDYQGGLTTQLKIYRPDGSVFQSWEDVPAAGTFSSSTYRDQPFDFSTSDPAGPWRFEATYNGQVYETFFTVSGPPGGWRSGEVDAGNGWWWTNWFGYYNTTYYPWVYHAQHGWLYAFDDGSGGVFFWYHDMQKFVWTTPATYPFLYRWGGGDTWLWYQKDSVNPRYFMNYGTGNWEALP